MLDPETVTKDQHPILTAIGVSRMEGAIKRPSGRGEMQRTLPPASDSPTVDFSISRFWHGISLRRSFWARW